MRIEIEIPDKYAKRDIFVFGGIDIVARRFASSGVWEVKKTECGRCGSCCKRMTGRTFPFSTPSGCLYLYRSGNEHLCGLSYYRPNGCAVAEMDDIDHCTVEWEKVDG